MNIGVFDSGIGGKLIAQKISQALPQAKIIFKSDPQFFPYGPKSAFIIQERLNHFTHKFIEDDCGAIVIACNSATTSAIEKLRHKFPLVKFIGIEPPIKPIVKLTRTGKIAIMGTKATVNSLRRQQLQQQYGKNVMVYNLICSGLAEMIETNPKPTQQSQKLLRQFLEAPIKAGVDVVGLACTHYPYLIRQMHDLYPKVTFYDPADAVVQHLLHQV